MHHALTQMLTPFGMTPPRTDLDYDRVIDHFTRLKRRYPANPRIDAVLHAVGCDLCDTIVFDEPELSHRAA